VVTPAGPPPSDHPSDEDADRELTVDELAARVGVTVRNVRAYSARGLLPPPRLAGRTGYYGREHVARLLLVREMLAEGYSLAMIERTLASAPSTASSTTLALHRALLSPWLPPEPEVMTGAELAARAGVAEDTVLVDRLVELGLVERADEGILRVLDPGVSPLDLIAAKRRVNEHVREIAQTYVDMFLRSDWESLVDADGPDQLEQVRDTVARLQPAAAQALLAAFRTEMAAVVAEAVETVLSRLAEE
jgi:DNA-binding transcriptional MerR regulator